MNILRLVIFIICLASCSEGVDDVLNVAIVNENPNTIFKEGLEFMKQNKNRPGVKVTRSGLQYEIMREGKGLKPGPTANVKVHYHGTTPSGEVFDSSVDRGQPATFGLNQVIKGWTEGLQLMSAGAKYKFFIPQELAYGAAREGAKLVIAARSTELLNKLQAEITESGSEVIAVPCDITNPENCSNLVNKTIEKYGRIDGLLNSAYRAGDFKEICDSDFTDWQETMNTNFFGTMNLTMAAVKKMESNAAIVMINSLITKKPLPTQGGYAASKGALATATKILAKPPIKANPVESI